MQIQTFEDQPKLNLINILLKTPPQSKNRNLSTTAIVKNHKLTPNAMYWIIGEFY